MRRRDLLAALAALPVAARAQTLPPPPHGIPGRLRIAGTPALARVVARWAGAFEREHPGIRVESAMTGSDIAMAALYTARCDIALLGRDATKPELQAFEWIYRAKPQNIPILRGSMATPGQSPALAAMVQRSNPLTSISREDLRAAFGDAGRKARRWGDLGIAGARGERAINLYLPYAESGTGRFFRSLVLADSNRLAWERLTEFDTSPYRASQDLAQDRATSRRMHAALARDPDGLAIGVADFGNRAIKVLAVVGSSGPPVRLNERTIASGAYPLARLIQAYFAPGRSGQDHQETHAFLQFASSQRAQAMASKSSGYLALAPGMTEPARDILRK